MGVLAFLLVCFLFFLFITWVVRNDKSKFITEVVAWLTPAKNRLVRDERVVEYEDDSNCYFADSARRVPVNTREMAYSRVRFMKRQPVVPQRKAPVSSYDSPMIEESQVVSPHVTQTSGGFTYYPADSWAERPKSPPLMRGRATESTPARRPERPPERVSERPAPVRQPNRQAPPVELPVEPGVKPMHVKRVQVQDEARDVKPKRTKEDFEARRKPDQRRQHQNPPVKREMDADVKPNIVKREEGTAERGRGRGRGRSRGRGRGRGMGRPNTTNESS